jgi:hypothetical protein
MIKINKNMLSLVKCYCMNYKLTLDNKLYIRNYLLEKFLLKMKYYIFFNELIIYFLIFLEEIIVRNIESK